MLKQSRTDGVFPLVDNNKVKSARDILEIYKYQVFLENRHSQLKTYMGIAPDYLKNPKKYITQLNSSKHSGFDDWRLPTLEEAKALITFDTRNDDLWIDTVFDKTQRWIWTVDQDDDNHAWVANFATGITWSEKLVLREWVDYSSEPWKTKRGYRHVKRFVRAVCSLNKSRRESMMKIDFNCPKCQFKHSALPEQAGKVGICKNCGTKITVPKPQSTNLNQGSESKQKFWGSTITLILGTLLFLSSIAQISSGYNFANLLGGFFIILGTLTYKSIKKRKCGLVENTITRKTAEIATLLLILVLLLSQDHYPEHLERHPLTNFVIPLAIFLACGTIFFDDKKVWAILSIFLGFILLLTARVYLPY